jgi:hypothetical protein
VARGKEERIKHRAKSRGQEGKERKAHGTKRIARIKYYKAPRGDPVGRFHDEFRDFLSPIPIGGDILRYFNLSRAD